MTSDSVIGVVIAALLSLGGVVYVRRSALKMDERHTARADDVERDRIESEAYKRARDSYEAGIADMVAQGKRRDAQHADELRYLNERLTERNRRIIELEEQLRETRKQVRHILEASEAMGSRLDTAERAIARNARNARAAEDRADVAEARADTAHDRADVSETRADEAETQANTDRGNDRGAE